MTTIYYDELTFDACKARSMIHKIGEVAIPIISIVDLIEINSNTKRYDGDMKDLVDAQELRKILENSQKIDIQKSPSLISKILSKLGLRS